jgi:hypothetical protein
MLEDAIMALTPQPNLTEGDPSTTPRWMRYKKGSRDVGDIEITELLHQSPKGAIYLTPGDNLVWDEEENVGKHWERSKAEAINLLTPVKTTIKDTTDRNRSLKMLAAGLNRALNAPATDTDVDFLVEAREFIRARQLEILQVWYFVAAVVTVVVTTVTLFLIIRKVLAPREFLIAALLGGVGAIISVSQRFRSINMERYASRRFTAIGGCSRIVFGCMFGAVFLLFQKGGIVLSVANGQPYLLAAAAVVAGFSERAIPEVLAQVEHQIATSKTSER